VHYWKREREAAITGYATVMMMSSGVDCELISWHVLLPLAVQQMRPEAYVFGLSIGLCVRMYVNNLLKFYLSRQPG